MTLDIQLRLHDALRNYARTLEIAKKKRSKSGDVPSFPRRERVLAVISLPSGQPTALDPYHEIT